MGFPFVGIETSVSPSGGYDAAVLAARFHARAGARGRRPEAERFRDQRPNPLANHEPEAPGDTSGRKAGRLPCPSPYDTS